MQIDSCPTLKLDGVTKSFRKRSVLSAVNLEFHAGEIVAVLGNNGAGKTTLLRLISGLLTPDEGVILLNGVRLSFERIDLRKKLYFLPDTPPVLPRMTVIEQIAMSLHLWGKDGEGREDEIISWIAEFGMETIYNTMLTGLSRGQFYKAALLGMLAVDPDIYLLDEPFASGMDPQGIDAMQRHLRAAAARGKLVIYTTQILKAAEAFCDKALILGNGGALAFGEPSLLKQEITLEKYFQVNG